MFRRVLRLKERSESLLLEVSNELLDLVHRQFLNTTFEDELLHSICRVQDSYSGKSGFFDTNEFGETGLDAVVDA
jgi:hypothetical protein